MARLTTLAPRLCALDTRTSRPPPKQADPELLTAEHKAWRLEVLKRAHWRCQWPGCGAQGGRGGVRLYADHIVERRDGGAALDPANGQALCSRHHSLKTARARAERMGL
ncbi:HNH endonuclease signature motif containing protein [Methylobacterium sp. Leaf118]|uniref:HNH endonuclease signature motif containing protein n=1 Tax=Methylobacterium sp. Leaf118 TaxID=2876562 RepID=UPI001E348311|nr:HNH endonuclease signature motif containing protein [Methylobacterium sp. Leaf118]